MAAMNATQPLPIDLPMAEIEAFCHRHHIKRMSLFGSVLRDDFRPESDIDVLVEFEEGKTPGLAFFGMGDELEGILGRKVDFLTKEFLSPRWMDRAWAHAVDIYVAADCLDDAAGHYRVRRTGARVH
jgi:uncharacterized protein